MKKLQLRFNLSAGAIAAAIGLYANSVVEKCGIDDPIAASSVHWFGGIWGQLSVGLFAQNPVPLENTHGYSGLLMGGGFHLLAIQLFSSVVLSLWGLLATYPYLFLLNKIIPLRMSEQDEILGADCSQHDLHEQEAINDSKETLDWIVQSMNK